MAAEDNSTVTLSGIGSPVVSGLQYRTNSNTTWTDYTINTPITLENTDDYVQFKNNSNQLSKSSSNNYAQFVMSGKIKASGNIQSMLNYSNSCTNYCYYNLFRNCSSLISAPTLPAITLATNCYGNMFIGCISLSSAPALPATTLDTYCYNGMFRGCTSLSSAPTLPATTLAARCYKDMFRGCTSLKTAPALPATTLASNCYAAMFSGCTSLRSAPTLPATTLTQSCYTSMFTACTSLSSVNVAFTNWNSSITPTNDWLSNVASSGIFTKPTSLEPLSGVSNIPNNWTVINK